MSAAARVEPAFGDTAEFGIRAPTVEDGAAIWNLVRDSKVLDLNSPYSYLLICHRFASTCLVATQGDQPVGFVTAFRPPEATDVIFVWQIGVAGTMRGQGVGRRLLTELVRLEACRGVRYLETTITPSNASSQRLFESFARAHDATTEVSELFTGLLFPGATHEPEELYRIGPLPLDPPQPAATSSPPAQ